MAAGADPMPRACRRHDALSARLNDPDHFPPPSEFARISKELSDLQASAESIREAVRAAEELEEADAVLRQAEAGDSEAAELESLAREERSVLVARIAAMEDEVMAHLVPRDEMDSRGVIMEFRAGAGGEEAGLFAAEVMAMYERFVQLQGWAAEALTASLSEGGGLREGSMAVRGAGAFGWLKWESGVHRVQRVPATESSGRIHTSTMTVAVLPEAEEVDVEFGPGDLHVETFRASGAGGQVRHCAPARAGPVQQGGGGVGGVGELLCRASRLRHRLPPPATAREHHGQRCARDARAHRHGGSHPGRAVAAPEQRKSRSFAALAPV